MAKWWGESLSEKWQAVFSLNQNTRGLRVMVKGTSLATTEAPSFQASFPGVSFLFHLLLENKVIKASNLTDTKREEEQAIPLGQGPLGHN